eukprot:gnl/MRDRNA2_/MRDRNA2_105429_c0_seq1.p1 gnl/MRDRNA2_/MRDRNA2_105429_c0~~gnl/MRDRNA2_/MRDRNA2_105429_c0_seq1.p1  ORF type:complete len:483 (-),score=129.67 gnl/MRDRNA2_/MRDRNA2_105429_c0_seq1:40-1488(-)
MRLAVILYALVVAPEVKETKRKAALTGKSLSKSLLTEKETESKEEAVLNGADPSERKRQRKAKKKKMAQSEEDQTEDVVTPAKPKKKKKALIEGEEWKGRSLDKELESYFTKVKKKKKAVPTTEPLCTERMSEDQEKAADNPLIVTGTEAETKEVLTPAEELQGARGLLLPKLQEQKKKKKRNRIPAGYAVAERKKELLAEDPRAAKLDEMRHERKAAEYDKIKEAWKAGAPLAPTAALMWEEKKKRDEKEEEERIQWKQERAEYYERYRKRQREEKKALNQQIWEKRREMREARRQEYDAKKKKKEDMEERKKEHFHKKHLESTSVRLWAAQRPSENDEIILIKNFTSNNEAKAFEVMKEQIDDIRRMNDACHNITIFLQKMDKKGRVVGGMPSATDLKRMASGALKIPEIRFPKGQGDRRRVPEGAMRQLPSIGSMPEMLTASSSHTFTSEPMAMLIGLFVGCGGTFTFLRFTWRQEYVQ